MIIKRLLILTMTILFSFAGYGKKNTENANPQDLKDLKVIAVIATSPKGKPCLAVKMINQSSSDVKAQIQILNMTKWLKFKKTSLNNISVPEKSEKTAFFSIKKIMEVPQKNVIFPIIVKVTCGNVSIQKKVMPNICQVKELPFEPKIDGSLAEWKKLPVQPQKLINKYQIINGAKRWKGEDDLSGTVRIGWKNKKLYLAADIHDGGKSKLQNNDDISEKKNDGLILTFDTDVLGDAGTMTYNSDDNRVFFSHGKKGVKTKWASPDGIKGVKASSRKNGKGYQLEAVIPLHNLNLDNKKVKVIGLDMIINDIDKSTKRGKRSTKRMSWTAAKDSLKNPSSMGWLILVE